MATINVLVRWADNTEQLRANLKQGINQLEATKASVESLVKSFSQEKLIQAAHRNVAAIQEYGGAFQLTKAQAKRSLSIISDAIAALERQQKPVPDAMRAMKAELEGVAKQAPAIGSVAERITGIVAAAAAAKVALQGLVSVVSEWTRAASAQEDATVRLNTALRAQGTFTPDVIQQYTDLATAFQNTTVFSDELVMEMEALLVQVGDVMPEQMDKALRAATDLAAGLRIDLQTATQLVGKAFAGETGTLKRYGIVIDEVTLKTKGVDAVLDAISNKMGGQAAAQAQTLTGQMARLGNEVDETQESIGGLLASGLSPLIDGFMSLPQPIQTGTVALGLFAAAGAALVTAITGIGAALALALPLFGLTPAMAGAAAMGALSAAASAAIPVFAALAAAIAAVWAAWKIGNTETVKNIVAEWALSSDNLTAQLFRAVMGFDQLTAAQARSAVAATTAAEAQAKFNAQLPVMRPVPSHSTPGGSIVQGAFTFDQLTKEEEARKKLAETTKRSIEEEKRLEQEAAALKTRLIAEEAAARQKAWNERAKMMDFIGMREMQDAADQYARVQKEEADYAALTLANAAAHRAMMDEIGVANMQAEAERMAAAEREKGAWLVHVSDLAAAFAQLGQITGGVMNAITSGIGTMISAVVGAKTAVDALKSGFAALGSGSILSGIAGVISGIGGIVGVVGAAISGVKALWSGLKNLFGGGVIGQVVNPARDAWFAGRGVQDIGDQLAPFMDGNQAAQMIKNVFDAKTPEELQRTTDAIDSILRSGSGGGLTSYDDLQRRGYAAEGGLVTEQGIQRFAQGGRVLNFVPRGIDTQPAMLAVGEGVVNRSGMETLGADGLNSLNRGRGIAAGGCVVKFEPGSIVVKGSVIHQDDLEKVVGDAAVKAIEKGGRTYGRFCKLVRSA